LLEVVAYRIAGPEGVEAGTKVRAAFEGDVAAWAVARRHIDGDDVLTQLSQARIDDRPLTDEEIGKLANMVVAGSIDTSVTMLSTTLGWLAEHPAYRRKALSDTSLFAGAVDEMLRVRPPTFNGRLVVQDVELGGQQLRAGDRVMMLFQATGFDPDVFEAPEEVRFDRAPNPHLGFGLGAHLCVGMHMARSLIRIALEEWHRAFPDYAVEHGSPPVYRTGYVSGVAELHLDLRPTSRL
jgi:cytochrome P450